MQLSETEYEIMRIIWEKGGSVTSADICELSESRGWKAPTVLTFLKRLCDKGMLTTEKQGKVRIYHPVVTRQEYARRETQALIDTLYDGKVSGLIANLAGQTRLTKQDAQQIESLLSGDWE